MTTEGFSDIIRMTVLIIPFSKLDWSRVVYLHLERQKGGRHSFYQTYNQLGLFSDPNAPGLLISDYTNVLFFTARSQDRGQVVLLMLEFNKLLIRKGEQMALDIELNKQRNMSQEAIASQPRRLLHFSAKGINTPPFSPLVLDC